MANVLPIGEIIGVWIAAGLTLMMFSFIYRDNVFFKFGEHLYLGISVGYFINIQFWQVIVPDVIRPLTVTHDFKVLIPATLGIFILLRLIPPLAWLSRIAFAFYIGGYAGLAIPQVINGVFLPQVSQTLRPFDSSLLGAANGGGWGGFGMVMLCMVLLLGFFWLLAYTATYQRIWSGIATLVIGALLYVWTVMDILPRASLNQFIILAGVFTVLIFFFFSLEHKKTVGSISKVGLYFIMISFGASFGYTVMARISLLIGRLQFLITDWIMGLIVPWFAGLFGLSAG